MRGPRLPPPAGIALAALLVLAPGAGRAQADAAPAAVGCEVAGYDLIIRNQGSEAIAAGTTVSWSVPFARKQGEHHLAVALEPGGSVFLSAAMGSTYLGGGTPCTVSIG